MSARTGRCLCGGVHYEASGAGTHATLCHCSSCRRASGAPVVAWVTFARDGFRWTQGAPAAHRSSSGVERTFCGRCGSPLTYARDDLPDEIDVTIATLDRPEDVPPSDHTWAGERLPWLALGDGLPRHPRARSG